MWPPSLIKAEFAKAGECISDFVQFELLLVQLLGPFGGCFDMSKDDLSRDVICVGVNLTDSHVHR